MHRLIPLMFFVYLGLTPSGLFAQNYPSGFAQSLVANGIAAPTALAFAPDGRIFVAEQAGRLRVIKNGALLQNPFVQLTVNSAGERGLIGIALDPDFENNQHLYLYYTAPGTPLRNRISRFTANGDVVVAGSELVILELDPLSSATNHNGGAMHFGKDGKLYVAVGENAAPAKAQDLDTYHGKLLRINKDGSVPEGNPFTDGSEQRKRIWSFGLRNPYTFAVHPETGQILVNDVGQGGWEEVNDATTGGKNFGWPTTEGKFNAANYPEFANPIYAYPHGSGDGKGCAITGGVFFYPSTSNYPDSYFNRYFFQDLCNQWINSIDESSTRAPFATGLPQNALSLSLGIDGNLYYLSRNTNAIYKIVYNNSTTPYIVNHPAAATAAEGSSATFTVNALGSPPLSYQWLKDGEPIANANEARYTIEEVRPADEGVYTVKVTNDGGNVTSNGAALTVVANGSPTAMITLPAQGTNYTAGDEISFEGTGTDSEDGNLPESAFQWQINFHHDTHKHDEPFITGVRSGVFSIPTEGETSDNVWYRIILTVTDSHGLTGKDSIDILPNKSMITVDTDPSGLEVLIDGQPHTAPVEIISVQGIVRNVAVNSPQTVDGSEYNFSSWSNDGEISQTFQTPDHDLNLVASFAPIVATGNEGELETWPVVFPNPISGSVIHIDMGETSKSDITLQLVNSLSQTVFTTSMMLGPSQKEFSLTLPDHIRGVHTLVIKSNQGTSIKRLAILK